MPRKEAFCVHRVEVVRAGCRAFLKAFVVSVERVRFRPKIRRLSARMSEARKGFASDMERVPEDEGFEAYREDLLRLIDAAPLAEYAKGGVRA